MKTTKQENTIYTIELNDSEAKWLRSVMQNPLYCEHPNDEEPTQRKNRLSLFVALNDTIENISDKRVFRVNC